MSASQAARASGETYASGPSHSRALWHSLHTRQLVRDYEEGYYTRFVTDKPVDRFLILLTQARGYSDRYRYVNVVELKPSTQRPPHSIKSRSVKRVLLRLGPVHTDGLDTPGIRAFVRAERVVHAMNHMDLALQAAELQAGGMQELFDYLWELETDDN